MSLLRIDRLPLPLIALLSLSSVAEATCYVAAYGLVGKQTGWTACPGTATSPGGVETCCIPGSECGEDSLCHVPASSNPGNNSWYQAGCTDSSYSASVCRNSCVDYEQTYVYYETSAQLWMCCGDGGCNGTNTDSTFKAVSPSDWKEITGSSSASSVPSTTVTASASSGIASKGAASKGIASKGSATAKTHKPSSGDFIPAGTKGKAPLSSTSPTSQDDDSSGLSTGAEAGIGVAIALAALALIAAIVAIVLFRRKRGRQNMVGEKDASADWSARPAVEKDVFPDRSPPMEKHAYETWSPYPHSPAAEMSSESARSELPTNPPVHELSSGYHWEYRF